MNIAELRKILSRNLYNSKGWTTNRKFVVIESDDWGTIRMPSKKVYNLLKKGGIQVDKCPFNMFDSLATSDDLTALFEVLRKFKDKDGNACKITANTIVANPNFEKIRESNFEDYHFELFTDTLKNYENRSNTFNIWKQGISEQVFIPQFHGREHLNISRWLRFLRKNSYETRLAFDHNLFGLSTNITKEKRRSYLAALDFENIEELESNKKTIIEGLKIFQEIFGFQSKSFIAPNYVWSNELNCTLINNGIKYIQSGIYQILPNFEKNNNKNIKRYIGQTNDLGQNYTIRNCFFEPSVTPNIDNVGDCLQAIQTAFRWRKPAIINSHRLNYIGAINEKNRTNNLRLLGELLLRITEKWPEVEFLSSDQLGDFITVNNN